MNLKILSMILWVCPLWAAKYEFKQSEDVDDPETPELIKYERTLDESIAPGDIEGFYFHELITVNPPRISVKMVGDVPSVKSKIKNSLYYIGGPVLIGHQNGGEKINNNNVITILIHYTFTPLFVFGNHWPNLSKPKAQKIGEFLGGGQVYSFLWSGKNNLARRKQAGSILANYIQYFKHLNRDTRINLVAHSHGGNVAKLAMNYASEFITQRPFIDHLLHIATPVRRDTKLESPDFYNYFLQVSSPQDKVVSIGGMDFKGGGFGKAKHKDKLADLNLVVNGYSHGDLVGYSIFNYLAENLPSFKLRYPHKAGGEKILVIDLPKIESTRL